MKRKPLLAFIVGLLVASPVGIAVWKAKHNAVPILKTEVFTAVANLTDEDFSFPPEVPAPVGHPPLRIVAGRFVYTVHYTTKEFLSHNFCWAFTRHSDHTIWLQRDYDSRETVTHELLHVAAWVGKNEDQIFFEGTPTGLQSNHDFIVPASSVLLEILRDNPKLTRWLTE